MIFNSIEYFLFLPIVFFLYWFVFNKNSKAQNIIVLLSSYLFYGWWDFRFLILIILSTLIDYFIGLGIPTQNLKKNQKLLLFSSIAFNLGILGFFKYYNFFIDSWVDLFSSLGYKIKNIWTLNIILPVGISFYTFQTMSYSIDVYFKKLTPTKDFLSFASYVAFFPQLVAGPIERATNLLPQFAVKRKFNYEQSIQGFRLIIWGLFKKVVIADTLAIVVNKTFGNFYDLGGGDLWIGAMFFGFQIYCDFSGYSDIAIGTSKLLGIEIMSNFKFPYFSRNIGEFWRRWHISLSSWFRDYLYIPLGGSKNGNWKSIRNIFIVFIVSGFWHGANWTFIFWGIFHALLFVPSFILKKNRRFVGSILAENSHLPSVSELLGVIITFISVTIGWVFFRSNTMGNSLQYLLLMFSDYNFSEFFVVEFLLIVFLLVTEFLIRKNERLKPNYFKYDWIVFSILFMIILFNLKSSSSFIYFQF